MCSNTKGLLKRFVPFFLTFGAGLLIASFFIPVTGPNFSFRGGRRQHKMDDMRREERIKQLEEENMRLRDELGWHDSDGFDAPLPPTALTLDVPPPPPPAPAAPRAPKTRR